MNLFNIQQQYLSLAEQLSEGEFTSELEQALIINETELKEKAVNYGFVIRGYEYNNTCIDNEIKRLQELKKRNTNVVNRLENAISEAMKLYGIEKVESPTLKLSFRKSESVEIVNEAQLAAPFKTLKTTCTPNKTLIKEAIKNGEVVEGAILVTNLNLQIK